MDLATHFKERRERAALRLARTPGKRICFAILGLKTSVEDFEFLPGVHFQRVEDPPGEIELAAALKDPALFSAIGRYSHSIGHELAIETTDTPAQENYDRAWWCLSALRVRCLPDLLVPAVADSSWSTMAAVPAKSCHAQLLEDSPRARKLGAAVDVTRGEFEWVANHVLAFRDLLEDTRFRIAVDSLTTHHHHENLRMMAAMLWAGIEALFAINAEISFRLALYIAVALEPRGAARLDAFKEAKRLYSVRSKAVHGATLKDDELLAHIVSVRKLLSRLLCSMTERASIPSAAELEESMLT